MSNAETLGYAKGYAAGKRRKQKEIRWETLKREEQAFLDKAFLAALPTCIGINGWAKGGKPITDIPDRVGLAWDFAALALKSRRYAR
jgi:hypothetical protein